MDSTKDLLCATALDLFMKHKVTHDQMFKWIRDTIRDAIADKPNDKVLYNASYGWYSINNQFKDFVNLEDIDVESKEFRMKASAFIIPFAKTVLDKQMNEGLRDALIAYKCSDIHKVRRELDTIYRNRCRLANLEVNIPELEKYLSNPYRNLHVLDHPEFQKATVEYLGGDRPNTWFCSYSRKNLEEILHTAHDGSYQKVLEGKIRDEEYVALKYISRDTLEEYVSHLAEIRSVKKQKEESFMSLLDQKGYKDPIVWKSQDVYKFDVITYIIKYGITPDVATTKNDKEYVALIEEEFGLICASEDGSKLAIREIPYGMSWHIREYDGWESIEVV